MVCGSRRDSVRNGRGGTEYSIKCSKLLRRSGDQRPFDGAIDIREYVAV